jgi:quercetin dioxygenase-like cupin family protein
VFDEVHESYFYQGQEGRQLLYSEREVRQIHQGSWLSIKNGEVHQLGNKSSSDLITIHYRYFKQPILREDNE